MNNWIMPVAIIGASILIAFWLYKKATENEKKSKYQFGEPNKPTDVPGPQLNEWNNTTPIVSIINTK